MQVGSTTLRNYAALCRSEDSPSNDPAQVRAYDRMHRAVDEDPTAALRALVAVSRRVCDDADALGFLGSDALEDLFRDHAEVLLDRLEQRLPEDEPLRVAARTIWLDRHDSSDQLRLLIGDVGAPTLGERRTPQSTAAVSDNHRR